MVLTDSLGAPNERDGRTLADALVPEVADLVNPRSWSQIASRIANVISASSVPMSLTTNACFLISNLTIAVVLCLTIR